MQITVDNNQIIGKADKMLYGHFIEHFHRQIYGGLFDVGSPLSDEDGFRTDVIAALRDIRVPVLRWPGGCFVSAYNWKYGVGKERRTAFDKAWRVEEPNTFGTDEYIKFCRKIGCEPYICTNAGTGTAEEMSDWVEYCNIANEGFFAKWRAKNASKAPYGVKYWSIGNENWGGHEVGAKTSEQWGALVREAAKMMHRVDPSIELSAASIADLDWNLNLLRSAGQLLDWVSIHDYWDFSPDGVQHASYEEVIAKTGKRLSRSIDRVRSYLTALELHDKIKIAYDEWNLRGWYHPNVMNNVHRDGYYSKEEYLAPRDRNDDNKVYTMADAVFSACFLNTCLRNCDIVGMACFSPVVNTRGCICTHKEGIVLRPTYYVFYLFANLLGENVLDVWNADTPLSDTGDMEMSDVVVTRTKEGYAVSAINKDAENECEIGLRFLDAEISKCRIHCLNGKSKNSYNDIGKTEVGISVSEWTKFGGKVTLPPHSVNVIELV
ncbi:MAG: alpha-L-arabinofuranosidase C-terminal domain-containing protein [Clostridia bacterium]|nr:alpha-L-arabinofuranosidase C-terminal domain-containing protein [Clostridia bacterium]